MKSRLFLNPLSVETGLPQSVPDYVRLRRSPILNTATHSHQKPRYKKRRQLRYSYATN